LEALFEALRLSGKPEIFNSNQGCQFTSIEFTDRLKVESVQINVDGRGRALDNIFVERLWRTAHTKTPTSMITRRFLAQF
jgi:putative transposase